MKKNNSFWLRGMLLPFVLLCQSFTAKSQMGLSPGDSVPELLIESFMNKAHTPILISPENNKLIILDFWTTWCKSCIKALPKLESLQKEFDKDLQLIAVTNQKEDVVRTFLKKMKLQFDKMQVSTDDTVLKKLFPHEALPHTVWIRRGKVLYVTYGYNVNAMNIKRLLAGEQLKLSLKDGTKKYDPLAPLWGETNKNFGALPEKYSYITGWLSNFGGRHLRGFYDSTTNVVGKRYINVDIKNLIVDAYGEQYKYSSRLLVEDSAARYVIWNPTADEGDEKRTSNLVCYELAVGKEHQKNIPSYIKEDLRRYLNFEIAVEKRSIRSYVIERNGKDITPFSCEEKDRHFEKIADEFSFCGDFNSLVMTLQREFAYDAMPIIDKSGYDGNIRIDAKGKLNDIAFVKTMLAKYGFKMTERYEDLDMLIFKKKQL